MARLTIDGQEVEVPAGATLLDGAMRLGIEIPTLCHLAGYEHFTSCMLCVVEEKGTGRLLPACSAPARDGMVLDSRTPAVADARKMVLDLLLSEHTGDCEGPCQRACPAHMNIPLMIRQIGRGQLRDAIVTVKRDIALPAVLGRICPAPCEKVCRRQQADAPLSICLLKRYAADVDLESASVFLPAPTTLSGRRVAIVGAGPTGLAAAWYLQQQGHACTVFDEHDEPGGQLRIGVPEARLPRQALDREIAVIRRLGAIFRPRVRVGRDMTLAALRQDHDAVVLATGSLDAAGCQALGVPGADRGVKVDGETLEAGIAGVFAGGAAIGPCKMAVKAGADGKRIAASIDRFLRGADRGPRAGFFNSTIGKLRPEEIPQAMKEADQRGRVEPSGGPGSGFTAEEALRESARCLHCDCRKLESCRLRLHAGRYQGSQHHYKYAARPGLEKVIQPGGVYYESGKCIKCGLCVRITEARREPLGLTFIGRGFDVKVGVPFDDALSAALRKTAEACVNACPTGALAFEAGDLDRDVVSPAE